MVFFAIPLIIVFGGVAGYAIGSSCSSAREKEKTRNAQIEADKEVRFFKNLKQIQQRNMKNRNKQELREYSNKIIRTLWWKSKWRDCKNLCGRVVNIFR
jgi:hypothetical protein